MKKKLVIATRSSKLALWQANWVKDQIKQKFPQIQVELNLIKTKGDKILDTPLAKIGGKGLFVKELEVAILQGEADIAVHSMKDVPVEIPAGLEISVITKRENPDDAFVANKYKSFSELPSNAVVGTSSLRRIAQLTRLRPDIKFESLRGNVNTRLRKLDEGQYEAIILAAAGLIRLKMKDRIQEYISHKDCLPAIGQGIVCIETRLNDQPVMEAISFLQHAETHIRATAERAFLQRLNGGCQVPLAGHAILTGEELSFTGMIANPSGDKFMRLSEKANQTKAFELGHNMAEKLISLGGREILAEVGIEVN